MLELLLTKNFANPAAISIDGYLKAGGYEGFKKALTMTGDQIIEEMKKGNLRGRGGAGFSCGMKWSFLPKDKTIPRYLCVNADEGEPGTFKDRLYMARDPHHLIEGIAIACHALEIYECWIYIRGEFVKEREILEKAVAEAREKGLVGDKVLGTSSNVRIRFYSGAGAYICGEETALLSSLEGNKGYPRLKPPFPAIKGLYQKPTIVNNVETLACLPELLLMGGEAYAKLGSEKNGGTKLYCLSGHVKKPGLYELPMGVSLRELIYTHGGGIRNDNQLKAVQPGGSSSAILTAGEIDVALDFDSLMKAGTMLGSAAIMVMDDKTCMLQALRVITRFYAHESCGQCSPCREGTLWADKIVKKLIEGTAKPRELDDLVAICNNMAGKTICVFSDAVQMPVVSIVKKFRAELEEHQRRGGCQGHTLCGDAPARRPSFAGQFKLITRPFDYASFESRS